MGDLNGYQRPTRQGEWVAITDRGQPVTTIAGLDDRKVSEVGLRLVLQEVGDWREGKPRGLADSPMVPGCRAEEEVLENRRRFSLSTPAAL